MGIYVGVNLRSDDVGDQKKMVFFSETEPTHESHSFIYVIGEFETVVAADFMCKYGQNNPHLQCVDDAERLADRSTVTLPDGFNGHTVECFRDPIETNGDFVKLRVVGSHMIRWALKSDLSLAEES